MSPSDQILPVIEAAEQSCRKQKWKEAYHSIGPVLKSLEKSSATKESFPSKTLTRLVKILRNLGDEFDDDPEQYEQAQLVLDKALKWYTYPNDRKLIIEQGWLYYDKKQYDKAAATFQRVIGGNGPAPNNEEKIEALRGAGASLRQLRRYQEAKDYLSQAVAPGEEPPAGIRIERGWLCFRQGDYDLAFGEFEKAAANLTESDAHDKLQAKAGQVACRQAQDTQNSEGDRDRGKELMDRWLAESDLSKAKAVRISLICGQEHSDLNHYPAALLAYELALKIAAENKLAWGLKIEALQWLRRYEEAERVYKIAQRKFPESIELWNHMGYAYYWQKRFPEALDYFSGEALAKRDFPDPQKRTDFANALKADPDAAEWTVVSLRKMNKFTDAETKVNEALVDFGNTPGLLCEKAAIHFSRQEYETAIEVFDRALKIDEYNPFAHQWRAASFRKLRKFDEAKKGIDAALQKAPPDAGLWEELAWISFDQIDLKEADKCFAKSIELDPCLIQRQYSRAEVLARLNLNEDGLEIFQNLKKQFPGDAEVSEQLGWFYLRLGRWAQAKEEFDCILKTDPENVLGINGQGGYYLEQFDYEAAENNFRLAAETTDYEPQYRINLAWALLRQVREPGEVPISECSIREGLLNDAAESCRNALKLDPYNAKAYICLGVIAFKRDSYLDAEGYFRKSLELNPADGGHVELGALYVQMGRYDDAENELAEAIKLNNNDARAHIELGNLLLLTESNQAAVRECRHAVWVDPNNYETHRALAIALMRAGQYDEAEKAVRRGMKLVRPDRQWQLKLVLSQILIRFGDDGNKDRERYEDALQNIYDARRSSPLPNADIHFHAGIAEFRLEDYRSSRKSFVDCVRANRDRFDAERYGKLVDSVIRQERTIAKANIWGGRVLSGFCLLSLIVLWGVHFGGWILTVPASEQASNSNVAPNGNAAQNANVTESRVAPQNANVAQNANVKRNANVAQNRAAPQNANVVQDSSASVTEKSAVAKPTPMVAKLKEELAVDKPTLTVITPILLGLMVIGLLLPNLNKIKLPGGIEADISEPKTKDISSGPKGEIGFGSSLPTISPGPQ